jgi:two-component system phosphate regulon sensor histidine kinase PhoR
MTRIFWKLLLTFFGLLAVAGLGLDYLVTQVSETNLRETLEEGLLEQARLAREMLQERPAGEYPHIVGKIAASIGARVTVIQPDGTVLADSQANPANMENHASRPEFMQAMNGSIGVSTRYSNTVGIDFLYVAIPAGDGYLRLALPLSEVQARSNRFRANVIGVILVAMIPAIFGAAWLARRVSARLSQIITFSQQLAQGNFQVEVPEFRGGELGELGRTLRTTSEQLRSMFEQLQRRWSRRRPWRRSPSAKRRTRCLAASCRSSPPPWCAGSTLVTAARRAWRPNPTPRLSSR